MNASSQELRVELAQARIYAGSSVVRAIVVDEDLLVVVVSLALVQRVDGVLYEIGEDWRDQEKLVSGQISADNEGVFEDVLGRFAEVLHELIPFDRLALSGQCVL